MNIIEIPLKNSLILFVHNVYMLEKCRNFLLYIFYISNSSSSSSQKEGEVERRGLSKNGSYGTYLAKINHLGCGLSGLLNTDSSFLPNDVL